MNRHVSLRQEPNKIVWLWAISLFVDSVVAIAILAVVDFIRTPDPPPRGMQAMADPEKPKLFKFHLSTAVAVSIAAGFWLDLNFAGRAEQQTYMETRKEWGWPFNLSFEGSIQRGTIEERDCEDLLNGQDKLQRRNGDYSETLVKDPSGQISFKQVIRAPKKYIHAGLNLALGFYFCYAIASVSEWLICRREGRKA